MNDYERVARVIRYLDAHRSENPGLDAAAREAGRSRFHVHRLFTRWAGVTPKGFLQCLAMAQARERLRAGASVLDAALDSGLSSPGRLHDLSVRVEAATPGEVKSGGDGWLIHAGFAESPFGWCVVGEGPRGICHLGFMAARERAQAGVDLTKLWPRARVRWDDGLARSVAARMFVRPATGSEPLRALVRGSEFQLRVWRALVRVPEGALVTYGRLAEAAGAPGGARAAGTAVGANPVAYVIPCHRVIRETGVAGGYRWGAERKRLMLAREGCITGC
jgi:AraC family transcriptional regulator of adaptative response/methylated-DNA-[protein]-cysteine methyltransferase